MESYLLQQLAAGDEDAFSQLFFSYKSRLYSFVLAITRSEEIAEDTVQDVFLKVWHNREQAADITNFNALVYRMAKNRAIDQLKHASREINNFSEIIADLSDSIANDPYEKLNAAETHKRIQDAVARLPKQQRLVYEMHREQGFKHEEIAEKLNLSASTIRSHLMNALNFLRASLSWLLFIWIFPIK